MGYPNLAKARRRSNQHMHSTCEVRRPTHTPNGRGGYTDTHTVVYNGKCLITRRGTLPWEREFFLQQEGRSDLMIHFPHGTDVRVQDTVYHVEAATAYEVLGNPPPLTHQPTQIVPVRGT